MSSQSRVSVAMIGIVSSMIFTSGVKAGDAARGETAFGKCAACHSLEPDQNRMGPSLHGVLGREAGSGKGFRYSNAMKAADLVWSAETLDRYLAAPREFIPGNRMPFPGLKDARERADLIAYLEQAAQAR